MGGLGRFSLRDLRGRYCNGGLGMFLLRDFLEISGFILMGCRVYLGFRALGL